MRKELSFLLVILAYALLGWALGSQVTSPTLTVGSGAITRLQTGAVVESALNAVTGSVYATLPVASTAGTALLLVVSNATGSGPFTISAVPSGWVKITSSAEGVNSSNIEAWIYLNNPGGIASVSLTGGNADWWSEMSEWSNVAFASATDTSGTATAVAGTTLALSTAAITNPGDVAVAAWVQRMLGGTVVFTTPAGWTRLTDSGATAASKHLDLEYLLNPAVGLPLNVTLTSDTATNNTASGLVVVLKAATPVTTETDFITYGSIQAKLNTLDLGLMLGGRHLLESAGPGDNSGHLLEDGSGVRLLDTYLPQLGDPVTMTNPSWSGRVTSVNSEDVFQDGKRTNYNRAAIEATNSTAAPGGTAPGDFADTAVGGHHLLEDGTGARLLEDGTYYHLLEGTAFVYRNLSLRKSQNQDGTTTTYGYLETFETGYAAGMTFTLTSVNLGIAAVSYTITNVTTSFIGAGSSPTPVYGIEFGDAYQTLQTAGGGVLTRTGNQATQQLGVAMPAGSLGYAQVTATQTPITVQTDATGLTVTVTVVSGRRVNLKAFVKMSSTTATDLLRVYLMEGATQLTYDETVPNSTAATPAIVPEVILTPTAGVHTYKVQVQRAAGAGTVTLQADATFPAYIMAEDAGT